jgi:hypothetical protein
MKDKGMAMMGEEGFDWKQRQEVIKALNNRQQGQFQNAKRAWSVDQRGPGMIGLNRG